MSTIPENQSGSNLPGTGLDSWLRLLRLGYEPIPIMASEKRPLVKGWTTGPITEDRLRAWAVQHPDHKSTGCRTGRLVGVDVDLTDTGHAETVANAVQEVLGLSMYERVGSKGCALYYRNETPIPKIRIFGVPPKGGKPQGVELFGTGGQMVVFGIHPTTGGPYTWANSTILDHPLSELQTVTPDKLWQCARVIHAELARLGYTGLHSVDDMVREPAAATQEHRGDPITAKMLERLLAHIDPGADRPVWIAILCAIKYAPLIDAEDFDRMDLFVQWSAGELNDAHDPGNFEGADDCREQWGTMKPQDARGDGAGLGTIIHLARKGGYADPIRVSHMERMLSGVESAPPVDASDVADADIPDAVEDWWQPVRELNDRFAIITGGKQSGFIIDRADPREPHFLKVPRFNSIHSHIKIRPPVSEGEKESKEIPISTLWTGWAGREEITSVVFIPPGAGSIPEGSHNMWQGFAVEPVEGTAHDRFLGHVRTNICGSDEDAFEWLITWMADLVQRPGNKPGAAIALIGETGAGKSIFYEFLKAMFGTHAASVSDSARVIGNFNAHMAGLCVLGIEEGFWAGDKRAEAKLRDMITNPTMNMEQKGVDSIEIANHVHIVVTSNEQWVVPVTFDDRRWTIFRVDPARKMDKAYWKPIHETDLKGDGPANLLHYLLNRKNSPREKLFIPYQTDAKIAQATETMDSVSQWWLDVLRGDRDPVKGRVTSTEDGPDSIFGTDTLKQTILTDYQDWCDDNPRLRRLTPMSFWRAFRGIMGTNIKLHRPAAPEGKTRQSYAWFSTREFCQTAFAFRHRCDWDILEGYGFGIWSHFPEAGHTFGQT